MVPAPSRPCWTSWCWPLSGHVWYRPVHKRPGGCCTTGCHSWPYQNETISPGERKSGRVLIQYSLLAILMVLLTVWLGAEYEQYHVRNAPSTVDLYQGNQVCGILVNSSGIVNGGIEIETFASVAELTSNDEPDDNKKVVAHCGSCGSCSNPNDVRIYDTTRNTLFQDTTACAKKALLFGRKTATKCMAEAVGFTSDCSDCWVENIMCDLRLCIFSCLWYGVFSQVDGGHGPNNTGNALNPCLQCDEKRCGREFVTCAGANRRRSGILSNIQRDTETEVCDRVTSQWWEDETLQQQWHSQNRYGGDHLQKIPVAGAGTKVDPVTYRNAKKTFTSPPSAVEQGGLRRLQI